MREPLAPKEGGDLPHCAMVVIGADGDTLA